MRASILLSLALLGAAPCMFAQSPYTLTISYCSIDTTYTTNCWALTHDFYNTHTFKTGAFCQACSASDTPTGPLFLITATIKVSIGQKNGPCPKLVNVYWYGGDDFKHAYEPYIYSEGWAYVVAGEGVTFWQEAGCDGGIWNSPNIGDSYTCGP
jgi:hypothetical protein